MAHSLLPLLVVAVSCSVCLVQCVPASGSRSRENMHMAKLILRDLNDNRHQLSDDIRAPNTYEMSPYFNTKAPLQMSRRQNPESPEFSIGVAVALLRDLVRVREASLVREANLEANEDDLEEIGKRRFD